MLNGTQINGPAPACLDTAPGFVWSLLQMGGCK